MRYQMKLYVRLTSTAWLCTISLLVLLGGCTTLKQKQARLLDATSFGMEQIAPRVYVSKEVSDDQRKQLLSSIEKARHRVTTFYGGLVSDPTIYGCATQDCIEFFGGMGDGYAVQMTGILLWPKSFIPEPIAHEWSHVELFARLGDAGMKRIPGWFNEGLAVVVSELPQHSEAMYQEAVSSGYAIPSMSDLHRREWGPLFKQYENPKGINIIYSTVGHEVRMWYQRVGQAGLLRLIEALKAGKKFSDIYP
jgi:hypothetical protein